MAESTTKKTVAKRGTRTPDTDVIEGQVVDMTDEQAALLAALGSVDAAAAYATKYIAEYKADILTGERAGIKAARAAYAAVAGKWAIESGEKADNQITLEDLGQKLADGVAKRWDEKTQTYKPYSKAMVSGWRNTGAAYAAGVDPESPLGLALLGRYAQFGPIRKAIEAPDVTVESIEKAVEAKKADEKKKATTTTTPTATPPEAPKTPLEQVQAILAGMTVEEGHALLAEAAAWLDSDEFKAETPAA